MPKQVLPSRDEFEWLERELSRIGFRSVSNAEFRSTFKRLGLCAPRPQPGRETGFIFTANELTVYVWTTWIEYENRAREMDSGWILICKGDKREYVAHPFHRTENFTRNLYQFAWIARWRVVNRPLCPQCSNFMDIARGEAMKSRYWRCDRKQMHPDRKPYFLDWDINLPPKAKKLVTEARARRKSYRAARTADGKDNFVAIRTRKRWGMRKTG